MNKILFGVSILGWIVGFYHYFKFLKPTYIDPNASKQVRFEQLKNAKLWMSLIYIPMIGSFSFVDSGNEVIRPTPKNDHKNQHGAVATAPQANIDPAQMELMRKSYPRCYALAKNGVNIFAFSTWDLPTSLTEGTLNFTEVAIKAKNKAVCTDGVVESRTEIGDATVVSVETGRLLCYQYSDNARLAAVKLDRKGYNIIGKFVSVQGRSIRLDNCEFLTE